MAYWFDGQGGWIKEGNGAATFLNEVTGERFVLAGMMSEKKRQSIFEGDTAALIRRTACEKAWQWLALLDRMCPAGMTQSPISTPCRSSRNNTVVER